MKRIRLSVGLVLFVAISAHAERTQVSLGSCPSVSRDGSRLAFEWNDRIWLAPTVGGEARPITPDSCACASPVLSPDGRRVAFTSDREGCGNHVFVYDVGDGSLRQVSYHSEKTRPCAWTPDGSNLLVVACRDHVGGDHADRMGVLSATARANIRVLLDAEGADPALSPDGRMLLFRRRGDRACRKRLQSPETPDAGEIWAYNLETETFEPVFGGPVDARNPVWAADGKGFYFLFAEGGVRNVCYRRLDDAKIVRLTDFRQDHVFQLSVSADGSTAVFRQLFDFWRLDLKKPGAKPEPIRLTPEAGVATRPSTRRRFYDGVWNNDEPGDVAFSPDGKAFAFTTGGDLYVMDGERREPKLVHGETLTQERTCTFSPDGNVLYYVSDRGDGSDLWKAVRGDPKKAWWENDSFVKTRLQSDDAIRRRLSISPDGGSLAWQDYNGRLSFADTNGVVRACGPETWAEGPYAWNPNGEYVVAQVRDKNLQEDVVIASTTETGKHWLLTDNYLFDGNPTWSPDGMVIAWSSVRPDVTDGDLLCYVYLDAAVEDRERLQSKGLTVRDSAEKASPVPFERLRDRVRVTKVNAFRPFFASDSRTLAFCRKKATLSVHLPGDLQPRKIFDRTGRFRRWEKGSGNDVGKLFWAVDGKPAIGDRDYPFGTYQTTDIADYQELAFRTIWGRLRDQYYDSGYHGADWPAVREKYLSAARRAGTPLAFSRVVNLMFGELDSSHLHFGFTDASRREWIRKTDYHGWKSPTRHLGLRFDPTHRGAGWRIRDVIPESPADRCEYGFKPGDLVTRVNGRDVCADTDPTAVLNDPNGEKATVVVNGREMRLETINYPEARRLLEKAAYAEARRRVHALSGDRIGYLNIAEMDNSSLNSFRHEVYSEGLGRDGLVIDVRENLGGYTADRMMMTLFGVKSSLWTARGVEIGYYLGYSEHPLWDKPIVVLCSERTNSDAEIFVHAIRQTGRGKIVGRLTGGGVIGKHSVNVLDYGEMWVPQFGNFRPDGVDMERNGVRPDVEVDNTPADSVQGVDRQLERVVEVLSAAPSAS